MIDRGTYDVYVSKENEEAMKIGEYNHSGSFGELALMYNQPRSATIRATSDGILWVMGRYFSNERYEQIRMITGKGFSTV